MTRYFSSKDNKNNRNQVTVTLPVESIDYYRAAIRGTRLIDENININNSEMLQDIIFSSLNSRDVFYQIGKDGYTFKELLDIDLENSMDKIKNELNIEKIRIIREIGNIANELRAIYFETQRDSISSDTEEQLDDKLRYSLESYYDDYYGARAKEGEKVPETDKVISLIDKVRTKHNIQGNKEAFIQESLIKIYNNKEYSQMYYKATLEEEDNVIEKYTHRYIEEEELNDIDTKVRSLLENCISYYYESGLKYVKSINYKHFLELDNLINCFTDEIVAEYTVKYGEIPINIQYRIAEKLAAKRASMQGENVEFNATEYIRAENILDEVIKKYKIDEMKILQQDILVKEGLTGGYEEINEYIKMEIKIQELEEEASLKIVENKLKLTEIEEEIKLKELELQHIKKAIELFG